jgi:glutamate synthase (NADPH) small chain
MHEVPGSEEFIAADLVLLALGFVSPVHKGLLDDLGVKYNQRGAIAVDAEYKTSVDKVFAAGDSACGASLVVKAMSDAKKAALAINKYLIK